MKLRPLKIIDAPLMLEWMHDDSVVHDLGTDFSKKTLDDCLNFIEGSWEDRDNIHLAIADDSDKYMGTVSLKHIHKEDRYAEFAITVRKEAMGQGYSKYAMFEILRYGFEEVGLNSIYWYVKQNNTRALRFYDKNGFKRIEDVSLAVTRYLHAEDEYVWYAEYKGQ